ncbi:hypothetical protein K7432_002764 [Basidiobolus ranarum]|uniref:DASH complex subunit SPC19 n=1 Tax=Basidiobolus ranarum TaxID=34480 RepID=A0ABR2X1A1_9FUNG
MSVRSRRENFLKLEESLDDCITALQLCTDSVDSSIAKLKYTTRDTSRLNKIFELQQNYDLLTQGQIHEAQTALTQELLPHIENLFSHVDDINNQLEDKLILLEEELENKSNTENQLIQQRKIREPLEKKLSTLKANKEELQKSLQTVDEELELKEQELCALNEAISNNPTPPKPKNTSKHQQLIEELRSKLDLIDSQISQKERSIEERSKTISKSSDEAETGDQPISHDQLSDTLYSHLGYFQTKTLTMVDQRVSQKIQDYLHTLKTCQSKISEKDTATPSVSAHQIKCLFKLFFPTNNVGVTMSRIMELLIQDESKSIRLEDIRKEFPPDEEARHHFTTAIQILRNLKLVDAKDEIENGPGDALIQLCLL